jgi:hypothetical protein
MSQTIFQPHMLIERPSETAVSRVVLQVGSNILQSLKVLALGDFQTGRNLQAQRQGEGSAPSRRDEFLLSRLRILIS